MTFSEEEYQYGVRKTKEYERCYYETHKDQILTQQKGYRTNPLVNARETKRKRESRTKKRLVRTGMIVLENVEFGFAGLDKGTSCHR